jgi:hypothetical protein
MPERGESKRRRAARLLAGGVLGAAVVLGRRRRTFTPGLHAFEDAPCFRELTGSHPSAPQNVDRPPLPKETAAGRRMQSESRAAGGAPEIDAGDRRL